MATKPGQPLSDSEAEIVASLDSTFQPFALRHREAVLSRGVPFVFISGLRSKSQDAALYEHPPTGVAAKPGQSKHEIGFAYDATGPRTDGEWDIYAQEAERLGLESGVRYRPTPDKPHVEAPQPRADLAFTRALKLAAVGVAIGIVGLIAMNASKGK